jgi:hypothetical protein
MAVFWAGAQERTSADCIRARQEKCDIQVPVWFEPHVEEFIQTVIETGASRIVDVQQGSLLYCAQLDHDWERQPFDNTADSQTYIWSSVVPASAAEVASPARSEWLERYGELEAVR